MTTKAHFEKFFAEHNAYLNRLQQELNCDERELVRIVRAVFHVLRERLSVQHSFHVLANLPAFLKLYYIEGWKYHDKPSRLDSADAFSTAVEAEFSRLGGMEFPAGKTTAEVINTVIN